MTHKQTKTALFAILLLLATGFTSNAQMLFLWKGDFRLGLTVGLNHNFSAFVIAVPNTLSIADQASPALLQPEIGLYYGMEKEISRGEWSFGFDTRMSLHKNASSLTVKDLSSATSYDYSLKNTGLKAVESVYFAYWISRETQFTFGGGLMIDAYFGGSAEATPAAGAPECQFGNSDGMFNFGFGVGAALSAGLTYYLNDTFFLKGDLVLRTAPFFSTAKIDEAFWGDDNPWRDGSRIQVADHGSANLALMATIGFKW